MTHRTGVTRALLVLALGALAAVPAAAQSVEGRFERTLPVTGEVELEVATGSGAIRVRAGGDRSVQVSAEVRVNTGWLRSRAEAERLLERIVQNPPIEQNGNLIRIGQVQDEEVRRNVSISYTITTPAATRLRSTTGSGSQTIAGLRGPVEATTGSGSLTLEDISSEVRAATGSGSLRASNIRGALRASTGSGGIRAAGIAGSVQASTGSGSIEVEMTAGGDADLRTGSGGIQVSGVRGTLRSTTGSGSIRAEGPPAGDWRVTTSSGNVTVRLPADAAFELNARSSSGRIHSQHPVTVQGSVGRRELRGKVRGGGPMLHLSTASGSIRIE